MPVFDYRNTLGIPAEAPAQPVFQRTRQLASMPPQTAYESALQFEQQAPLVRANQGLAYLGAIQNQQAQIAQQAQNLRIQQEAQLAAQQATQGLGGITPDSPQYLSQRQQILQQNPNALLDPQFRNALNVYDQGYQQIDRQRQLQATQLVAQQKQAHSLGLRAIEYGANPDVVAEHVEKGNMGALAQIAGEARRSSLAKPKGSEKDYRDEVYANMVKNANSPENLPEIGKDETGKVTTIDDVLKLQAENAAKAHRLVYPEKYPQEAAPTAPTAPTADAPQANQTVFEKMNGDQAPATQEKPIAPPPNEAAKIISGTQDINTLAAVIGSWRHPVEEKEQAINRLKEIRDAIPHENLMPHELAQRRKRVDDLISESNEQLAASKVSKQYVEPVWDEAKNDVEARVKRYAQENNFPIQGVWNAIAAGKSLPVREAPQGYEDQFGFDSSLGAFSGNPYSAILGRDQDAINPKFNDALGKLKEQEASSHPIKAFFRSLGGGFSAPNYGKVLEVMAKEKASVAPQNAPTAQPPVANIKSVKQIP